MRSDAADVAELWRSVLCGEWTVTDRRDEDGRAVFIARPARAEERPTRRRVARDEELGRLVACGWSNKQIAYELGLAPSTVTADLQQLMSRLRLRSRFEVAAILSALSPSPSPWPRGPARPTPTRARNGTDPAPPA